MKNRAFLLLFFGLIFGFMPFPVAAQEAQPGDACAVSGAWVRSGGPEIAGGHILVCDGANWISILDYADSGRSLLQVDYDGGTCTAIKQGRLRYVSAGDQWDYCDGTNWTALTGGGGLWTAGAGDDIYYNSGTPQVGIGTATPQSSLDVAGGVKIGYDNRACTSGLAGSIRYNSSGAASTNGYFVITNATYTGNLGGLSGADSKCLTDLTANDWKGKSTATVDAAHVKVFLCDGTNCNDLNASTQYFFAHSNFTGDGGGSITTDGSSIGPANTDDWSLSTKFGVVSDVWSNRATTDTTHWSNAAQGTNHCTNWSTASAGVNGRIGHSQWSNGKRWNELADGCDNNMD